MATDKSKVVTYIDDELKQEAQKVADIQGRTLSNYVGQLIKEDVQRNKNEGKI